MVDIWDVLDERTRNEMELEKRHPAPREAVAELIEAVAPALETLHAAIDKIEELNGYHKLDIETEREWATLKRARTALARVTEEG